MLVTSPHIVPVISREVQCGAGVQGRRHRFPGGDPASYWAELPCPGDFHNVQGGLHGVLPLLATEQHRSMVRAGNDTDLAVG